MNRNKTEATPTGIEVEMVTRIFLLCYLMCVVALLGVPIEAGAAIEDCGKVKDKIVDKILNKEPLKSNLPGAAKRAFRKNIPADGQVCFEAGSDPLGCARRGHCCKLKNFKGTIEDQIKNLKFDVALGGANVLHVEANLKGNIGPVDQSRNRCNRECCNGVAVAKLLVYIKLKITAGGTVPWVPKAGLSLDADLVVKRSAEIKCGRGSHCRPL